ncbi:hypothetical protein J3E68DRAFT_401750 [Trichoderma sp. SZMC 28012]
MKKLSILCSFFILSSVARGHSQNDSLLYVNRNSLTKMRYTKIGLQHSSNNYLDIYTESMSSTVAITSSKY